MEIKVQIDQIISEEVEKTIKKAIAEEMKSLDLRDKIKEKLQEAIENEVDRIDWYETITDDERIVNTVIEMVGEKIEKLLRTAFA